MLMRLVLPDLGIGKRVRHGHPCDSPGVPWRDVPHSPLVGSSNLPAATTLLVSLSASRCHQSSCIPMGFAQTDLHVLAFGRAQLFCPTAAQGKIAFVYIEDVVLMIC